MSIPSVQITAATHYIFDRGLTKDVAVGIVCVLYAESGLKPGSQGAQSTETPGALNPSGAYGIASWNGPRQQALADFAARKNIDATLLTTQLDFVLTEAANSYPRTWAAIQNASTAYADMISVMVDEYENPKDKPGEIARAMDFAKALYAQTFIAPSPAPAPAPVPAPAPIVVPPAPAPAPSPAPMISNQKQIAFVVELMALLEKYGVRFD